MKIIIAKSLIQAPDYGQYPYTIELYSVPGNSVIVAQSLEYLRSALGYLCMTKAQAEELILREQHGIMPSDIRLIRWPAELCKHSVVKVHESIAKCLSCESDGTLLAPIHVNWMPKLT